MSIELLIIIGLITGILAGALAASRRVPVRVLPNGEQGPADHNN